MSNKLKSTFEIRPARNSGEGAIGYLMRLGRAHGVSQLPEMLLQIGVPWFKLAQGKYTEAISEAACLELPALSFDSGIVVPNGVRLRGEQLHRSHWSVHAGRRVCPECLAEVPETDRLPRRWHRAWWDVQPLTVCAVHHARLLGHCPECGERLNFRSCMIDSCPKGHLLVHTNRSVAGITEHAGDTYISGRLGAVPRTACAPLDAATLGEAIQALRLVGAAALKGHDLRAARDLEKHVLLDAGYQVFLEWPVAFDSILDGLLARSQIGPGRWGSAAAYGPLHAGLCEFRQGSLSAILKERVRRHAIANSVALSRTVFGVAEAPKDVSTIRGAARRLRLGFERTRREFVKRGFVPAHTRRGTPILIPQVTVETLLSERLEMMTVGQIAQELRIGRTQARRLIATGVFTHGGPFRKADIDDLLQRLSRHSPVCGARGGMPLPSACRIARLPIEAAVLAVLEGRASLTELRFDHGLEGLFVRISQLRAIGKHHRDAVTIEDAAQALNLKWETVRALIQLRLLPFGGTGTGIAPAAIEAFQGDFVAGAHLAKLAGMHPRTLLKIMSEAGITPVAAPPKCRQIVYRREAIRRARPLRSNYPAVHAAAIRTRTA
ncbi:TniQ family protein [Bradyrhizobium yuanmingense]|uniref:TniQ family protein n=1 Tax=Bradyrhizobium yuanmingense TaxID=108015 RepID=UPI0012FAD35E|nr:TniQ family protein [Bradyrhizobium yuanmingense]